MNDDPFDEYSRTEVLLYATQLITAYDHYDCDDEKA